MPIILTPISIAAAANQSIGILSTRDGAGVPQANIAVEFRLLRPSATDGQAYSRQSWTATSNSEGILYVSLDRGAHYEARRGDGDWIEFDVPDASQFTLPVLLGEIA